MPVNSDVHRARNEILIEGGAIRQILVTRLGNVVNLHNVIVMLVYITQAYFSD